MSSLIDTVRRFVGFAGSAVVLAAVLVVVVLAVPSVIGAKSSFIVLSGSMQPQLQPGDVVVVDEASPDAIEEGDVITYYAPGPTGGSGRDRVTHQVIAKRHTDNGVVYRTKGLANEAPDPYRVDHSQVIGEVWFHIPLVGSLFVYLDDTIWQYLLIIVPGLLLLGNGVWTFYTAAVENPE